MGGLFSFFKEKKKSQCSDSTAAGKRGRGNSKSKKEVEKPKEVVHVRARRGHATDSHSLAERVRLSFHSRAASGTTHSS